MKANVFSGLNAALLLRRTMDLGFLVADRKGQREHEDGSSAETVESEWKQKSEREGHCRVAAPTEKRGKTTQRCVNC